MDEKQELQKVENAQIVVTDSQQLAERIKNTDSIQEFLPIFNASIAKKQALRVLKREDILDKVTDKIEERINKRPDEITVAEYNAIDKTMSEQKQKELTIVNNVNDQPAITLNQQNVTVNVNGLNRDSNERVIEAVKQLLKLAETDTETDAEEEIIVNDNQN